MICLLQQTGCHLAGLTLIAGTRCCLVLVDIQHIQPLGDTQDCCNAKKVFVHAVAADLVCASAAVTWFRKLLFEQHCLHSVI
jgi:hypothetical protein